MYEESLIKHIETLSQEFKKVLNEGKYKPPVIRWRADRYKTMLVSIYGDPYPVQTVVVDFDNFHPFVPTIREVRYIVKGFCIGCGYKFKDGDSFEFHKAGALCPDCSDFKIEDTRDMTGLICVVCKSKLHSPYSFPPNYPNKFKLCCGCMSLLEFICKYPNKENDVKRVTNATVLEKLKLLARRVL